MKENKKSYFYLRLEVPEELRDSDFFIPKLMDTVDHVLYAMQVDTKDNQLIQAQKEDLSSYVFIFKTSTRKRKGQLNNFCTKYFDGKWNIQFFTEALTSNDIPRILNTIRKNKSYILKETIEVVEKYDGQDIQVFKNRKNWHPWQKEVFDLIYLDNKKIKKPDHRTIVSLIDFKGNSGKSSFWKYLYVNDKQNIGRLTYGTVSQLRSAAINMGEKEIYIIDLARTKASGDKEEDLLSIVEELKTGLLLSPMYGKNRELIIEPPHVILCANYKFSSNSLSKDRWAIYEIKDFKLGKKNTLLTNKFEKKLIKK